MSTSPSLLDWSRFLQPLQETLAAAPGPLSASELRAKLSEKKKPGKADIERLMDEEVARGNAYRWDKGKTARYWTRSPESEAREPLLERLAGADEPATADEYRKGLGIEVPADVVQRLLERLVEEGRCARFKPVTKSKGPRYWAGDHDNYARRMMLALLDKPKTKKQPAWTWAELAKPLAASLEGFSEDRLSAILQSLLDSGEVHKALKFKPKDVDRYSTRPPDLVALVRESFAEIYKKFAPAGVSVAEVNAAAGVVLGIAARPASGDLAATVLAVLAELKRERYGHTGLVPIPDVRRQVAAELGPNSARHDVLDNVIIGLRNAGKLNILPLNDATGVSAEERNDAIPDGGMTWFYLELR